MTSLADKQAQSNAEYGLYRIGEALINQAKLQQSDIEKVLTRQQEKNILFGEAAKELGLISDEDLKSVLSEQFGYAYINSQQNQIDERLIAAYDPFSREVEQLRSLREKLQISWFNKGHQLLAVTSVSKDDEASYLVANLAILFSQLNKKTLLIDTDLRTPKIHKLFNVTKKVGLTNILANRKGEYELSREKMLPNLSVLTAGTPAPNPQELLNRDTLTSLLDDLKSVYEVILIDTAPADMGLDYLSVLSKVNATMIVANRDKTLVNDLVQLKSQLEAADVTIVGSVLQ